MNYFVLAILGLLGMAVVYQSFLVYRNYGLQWMKATYRTVGLSSMHRSALFLLGETGADYMGFLRSVVPDNMPVVKPEGVGLYGSQSVMQFFLLPRGIPACPCEHSLGDLTGECAVCLTRQSHYVPSIGDFRPDFILASEKPFVAFPGESDLIRGIYIPAAAEINEPDSFEASSLAGMVRSAFLSLIVFASITSAGFVVSIAVLNGKDGAWSIALAFPIGAGLLTWTVFVLSWLLALPVTIAIYVGAFSLMMLGVLLTARNGRGKPRTAISAKLRTALRLRSRNFTLQHTGIWIVIVGVLLASTVISVVRAYSTFDGIANWALKGYAIAAEGSIFAGERWGGHSLEYPQNLHLQIGLFKLLDNDYLPGSKMLFPAFLGSLILGCLAFWRSSNVHRSIAAIGGLAVATTPILFVHSTLGFANLPMSVYLVLGVLIALDGIQNAAFGKQALGSLLIGLAAWTRLEAAVYSLVILLAMFTAAKLFRFGNARPQSLFGPMLLIQLPWLVFYLLHGKQTGGAFETARIISQAPSIFGDVSTETVKLILEHIVIQLRNVSRWGSIVYLSVAGLTIGAVRGFRDRDRQSAIMAISLGVIILLILSLFFFIGVSNKYDLGAWLNDSFDRHLIPAFVLLLVLSIYGMARGTSIPEPDAC